MRQEVVENEHHQIMEARFTYPRLNADRCVHAASPLAHCDACRTACPRQAWQIEGRIPQFDKESCDGCGLCYPACPEGAIELPVSVALRQNGDGGLTAFVACKRSAIQEEGMVSCIHVLGTRDLKSFVRQGVTRILASCSGCSACPTPSTVTLNRTLSDFNAIQQARGAPILLLEGLPIKAWRRALRAHRKQVRLPDQSRRWFLGLATVEPEPAQHDKPTSDISHKNWLYPNVPQIDPARCNGCDACVRLCPHDVLTLTSTADELYYALDPDQCTGCGLCQDVCDQKAISLHHMTAQTQRHLLLEAGRCSNCGAPFHMPRGNGQNAARCRICESKDNNSRLFQVITQ